MSQKYTEETLISSQQNAAWQRYLAAHNCTSCFCAAFLELVELLWIKVLPFPEINP
jgi:hypothetical protein